MAHTFCGELCRCVDINSSPYGVTNIIAAISSRPFVTNLRLTHNKLGDAGCTHLVDSLSSDWCNRHRIEVLHLDSNNIGNEGLGAITRYLSNNKTLKELSLRNNDFIGTPETVETFTAAFNTSSVCNLFLSSNGRLGDVFSMHFFPAATPQLRKLELSCIGLTRSSAPYLAEFIKSARCKLRTLQLNGNDLGNAGVDEVVAAIETNPHLTEVGIYANGLAEADEDNPKVRTRIGMALALELALQRNLDLRQTVESEAVQLLRYAWVIFSSSNDQANPNEPSHPFVALPLELRMHILSFLAPTLSISQCLHIFNFVFTSPVVPDFATGFRADPDPAVSVPLRARPLLSVRRPGDVSAPPRSPAEIQWVALVGCDVYDGQ